ncbi:tetratricopeptide repeat protein [Clostridium sp. E02]|uniref:tetratricopeptide repeat protein n=1 Tax=Clostridium sp. E02 TaxID=2487134 RepID=UPI000F53FE99|nr:tetratricopeptide repeat protein [Clostridium sp. E02]
MDKYEFNIKVEQIKKLVGKDDYETAIKIADTIDWRRVRNTNLLSMVAMVYEKNEDYQEAKDILLQAFERAPIGKRLLYKLAELAVKEGNINEAEAYYKEFGDLASEDPRQQLLRYMILKAKGAPAQQLIHSLESYTSVELDEKWLYELAELYSLAGMAERCVETCDRIMLMFGLGKYVDKAMELKTQYAPLTNYQMDLIENRDKYEAKLRAVEEQYGTRDHSNDDDDLMEEYEEDPEPEPDIQYEGVIGEEAYETTVQDAQVQESLAREMLRISKEEPEFMNQNSMDQNPTDQNALEHTRVLEDIRRLGRTVSEISTPDAEAFPSETVIEEEEPQAYDFAGSDAEYPQSDEYSHSEQYGAEMGYEQSSSYQTAVTAEAYQQLDPMDYSSSVGEQSQWDGTCVEDYSEANAQPFMVHQNLENPYDEGPEEEADLGFEEEVESEEYPARNHLMIEARTSEKGLQLAVEALKQIHKENGVKNSVAKITGSKLSKRGIMASAEKLQGKDLVIEEAGDLTNDDLTELNRLMELDQSGMIVVLIDNPKQMETLHREQPVLASKFECIGSGDMEPLAAPVPPIKPNPVKNMNRHRGHQNSGHPYGSIQETELDQEPNGAEDDFYEEQTENIPIREELQPKVHGEEMDIDEFAQYACRYANEIDCSVTGKSMLALYERIEIMEEDGIPLSKENAENLIEEAADHAEKPSIGKRLKGLFSTKYDKDGLLVLREEHFIY